MRHWAVVFWHIDITLLKDRRCISVWLILWKLAVPIWHFSGVCRQLEMGRIAGASRRAKVFSKMLGIRVGPMALFTDVLPVVIDDC